MFFKIVGLFATLAVVNAGNLLPALTGYATSPLLRYAAAPAVVAAAPAITTVEHHGRAFASTIRSDSIAVPTVAAAVPSILAAPALRSEIIAAPAIARVAHLAPATSVSYRRDVIAPTLKYAAAAPIVASAPLVEPLAYRTLAAPVVNVAAAPAIGLARTEFVGHGLGLAAAQGLGHLGLARRCFGADCLGHATAYKNFIL